MRSGFPVAVPGLAAGNHPLVEAGGQHIHGFRRGLDYAFIRAPRWTRGCGAYYPADRISWILVPAQAFAVGESMSLYRAGLKLAFFLPLGVAMPPRRVPSGFTDVSSVINQPSRVGATLDRTPVRKR
jgi:hypothetical protein